MHRRAARPLALQLAACLLWLLAFAPRAGAAPLDLGSAGDRIDLSAALGALEDPSGKLDIDEVAALSPERFHPAAQHGEINFGYSRSAWWLRLPVHAPGAGHWYLEVAYPSLDRLDLFTAGSDGRLRQQTAGDSLPFSRQPLPHRNLLFPVDLPAGDSVLYLRASSEGNITIPAVLWRPDAFHWESPRLYALFAVYYGLLAALGLYNLLLFFSLRDRLYLVFVLFDVSMAIGQAALNGFANQFLWPEWPAWGNAALPIGFAAGGFFGAIFTRRFLDTPRTIPRIDRALVFFMAWFLIAILTNLVSYRVAAPLTSLGGLLFSFAAWLSGFACLRRGDPGARYFLLAWSLLLTGVALMALRNFALLPTNFITSYAMQIGSALEMLLLSFALAERINTLRREKESLQNEALAAKQAAVEALQHTERELEARVEERTRELAAANAKLRDNEQMLVRLARQDPLTSLGNRMALEEDMARAASRARRFGGGVCILLIDLDRFKPINDTFGHAVGDHVLKTVAERLRSTVRRSDSVVRLGGDEFVILSEDSRCRQDAEVISAKLLAAISQPIGIDGLQLEVGASIGVARFPDDGDNLKELLARADAAMYRVKARGGGGGEVVCGQPLAD